jgi:DNA-binding transcriptional MocR family regulator
MRLDEIAGNVVDITAKNVKPVRADKASSAPSAAREKNYVVIPYRAIKDKRINTSAAYLVLSAMCAYTNRHGETWVSQQTVADTLGVSRQAIAKQQQILKNYGYLEQIQKGNRHFSSKWRVVFNPALTLEEVKTNTPAALREDPQEERIPLPKTEALDRLAALKNVIKGRRSAQPQELRIDEGSTQPQRLRNSNSIRNQNGVSTQPNGTFSATSIGCEKVVEGSIRKGEWLDE